MLIKITKNTVCNAENVFIGDEIETDKRQANILIRMDKAVEVTPTAPPPPVPAPSAKRKSAKRKQPSVED